MLDGRGFYFLRIDAGAVVGHADFHFTAVFLGNGDANFPPGRFIFSNPLFRWFQAVIDAVAHQMQQRIFNLLQDSSIDFHLAALDQQINLFALLLGEISDKFWKCFQKN